VGASKSEEVVKVLTYVKYGQGVSSILLFLNEMCDEFRLPKSHLNVSQKIYLV